jgi:hypothetical protein
MLDIESQIPIEIGLEGYSYHGGSQHSQEKQEDVEPIPIARACYRREILRPHALFGIRWERRRRKILG